MKILAFVFGFLLVGLLAQSAPAPFLPEIEARFLELETAIADLAGGSGGSGAPSLDDGPQGIGFVLVTYAVAEHGGTIGVHTLGETLPANAVIMRANYTMTEQFADSGSGEVVARCAGATIFEAEDLTVWNTGAYKQGYAKDGQWSPAGAAECEVEVEVTGADQEAGVIKIWLEYALIEGGGIS